ncbi:hypothetical protein [Peijinzhouia sedimentorum]
MRYLILVLVLSSCATRTENLSQYLVHQKGAFQNKFTLSLTDTISIEVPDSAYNNPNQVAIFGNELVYSKVYASPYDIDIYNILKQKYIRRIKLDKNLIKGSPSSLNVSSEQSIAFGIAGTAALYLMNPTNGKIESFDFSDVNLYSKEKPFMNAVFPSLFSDYKFNFADNENVIVSFIIPESFLLKDFSIHHVAKINIDNHKVEVYYEMPDNIYSNMRNSAYPSDLAFARTLIKGDTLLVTYPMDQCIYGYNINSPEIIFKKLATTSESVAFPAPLSKSDYRDREISWEFRITTPFFESLNYHEGSKLFTRILHHPQPSENIDGTRHDGKNRKLSVIILDENLNKVGETILDNEQMAVLKSIPLDNGFLAGPYSSFHSNEDEFIFKYLFKFKEVK